MRSSIWLHSPMWIDFCLFIALKFNYIFFLQILCFRFYITDFVRSTYCLLSSTRVDFWLLIALKSNQCFLLSVFCFFRLRHPPSFQSGVFPTADILFMQGDGCAVPRQPPTYLMCSSIESQGVLYDGLCAFNTLFLFTNVDWLLVDYWRWSSINAFC